MVNKKNLAALLSVGLCTVFLLVSVMLFAGCGNTIKIRFNLNYENLDTEATPTPSSIESIVIEKETCVADNEDVDWPAAPKLSGYTFKGWYKNADGTGSVMTATDEFEKNTTLYAKWEKSGNGEDTTPSEPVTPGTDTDTTGTWTVTFNANTAHGGQSVLIGQITVSRDTTKNTIALSGKVGNIDATTSLPDATPDSNHTWTRGEWYTQATGGTRFTTTTRVTSNITVYAHYTVKESGSSGESGDDTITEVPFNYEIDGSDVTIISYTGSGGVVTIPETIEGKTVTSFGSVFRSNTSITGVIILAKITNIPSYAFDGCSNLTWVVLPNTVTNIYTHAFGSSGSTCGLTKVYFNATSSWSIGVTQGGTSNTKYTQATKYYYSETQQSGKWHFVNGVPTVWS